MEKTFGISVYLRKVRINKKNEAPIIGRITVDGQRVEIALKQKVEVSKWDGKKSRVKGHQMEARIINATIDQFALKSRKIYDKLCEDEMLITPELIKSYILGENTKRITLLDVYQRHINEIEERIGIDFAKATLVKYKTTFNYIQEYIKGKYRKNDIYLNELKYDFITGFEHYMKTVQNNKQNSTYHHIQRFFRIINIAIANEWIEKNPFKKYSIRKVATNPGYLTEDELKAIEEKPILIERLDHIRNVFLFSCYTGIAYIDISNLTPDDIVKGIDGDLWINWKFQSNRPPNPNLN